MSDIHYKCFICDGLVINRERRPPGGIDTCENGHKHHSSLNSMYVSPPAAPLRTALTDEELNRLAQILLNDSRLMGRLMGATMNKLDIDKSEMRRKLEHQIREAVTQAFKHRDLTAEAKQILEEEIAIQQRLAKNNIKFQFNAYRGIDQVTVDRMMAEQTRHAIQTAINESMKETITFIKKEVKKKIVEEWKSKSFTIDFTELM